MKLNQLAGRPGSSRDRMRVGRGIGSGKGKTAGRGTKGQKSRAGVRLRGFEGGQMPLHRRLPKRGFHNLFAVELNEITVERVRRALEQGTLKAGDTVTADSLVKAGILKQAKGGVRLIGTGEIKERLAFEVAGASKSAIQAVEKAGGSVKVLAPRPQAEPNATAGKSKPKPATRKAEAAAGEASV